jgi:hypothetical protein
VPTAEASVKRSRCERLYIEAVDHVDDSNDFTE